MRIPLLYVFGPAILLAVSTSTFGQDKPNAVDPESERVRISDESSFDLNERRLIDHIAMCTVAMPSAPKMTTQVVKTRHGDILIRVHKLDMGDHSCGLTHAIYSDSFLESAGLDVVKGGAKFLEMASDGALKGKFDGEITNRMTVKLGLFNGIDQTITYSGGNGPAGEHGAGICRQVAYLARKEMMVAVMEISKSRFDKDPEKYKKEMQEFIASFQFLPDNNTERK